MHLKQIPLFRSLTDKNNSKVARLFNNKLLIFALVFAVLGTIIIWRGFSATVASVVEAEAMVPSSTYYAKQVSDTNASNGQAMQLTANTTLSGTFNTSGPASKVTLRAKGIQCGGAPQAVVKVDGVQVLSSAVSATSWTEYNVSAGFGAGSHRLSVSFTNANTSKKRSCSRSVYVDVVKIYSQDIADSTPVLTVNPDGKTISFTKVGSTTSYVGAIVRNPTTTRNTEYPALTEGSNLAYDAATNRYTWTPAAIPGETVNYGLRPNITDGPWAKEVTISWQLATTPTPTPTPTPPATSGMAVGIAVGNWGSAGGADVATAVGVGRLDVEAGAPVSDFTSKGIKLTMLFSGPYNSGGVSALNVTTWANDTLAWYKANCTPATCPNIEILNEPGGTWFWGSNAMSTTNSAAYANLLRATFNAFSSAYGSSRPKILASYDGGSAGSATWGQQLWAADSSIGNYIDGITVHPYGGTGDRTSSAQGRRASIADAYARTNKPIYITEVGWPTAVGQPPTGDSLQWTEKEQAANVYNFITWAKGTGYIKEVDIFNYRDYGTNTWYGLQRWNNSLGANGSKKPAWFALIEAKNGQTCSVCQ